MSSIDSLEKLIDDAWLMYLKSSREYLRPYPMKLALYSIANSGISMYVHVHAGSITTTFKKHIITKRYSGGKPARSKTIVMSAEEVLDELSYEAVSLLVMNPFIFGVKDGS